MTAKKFHLGFPLLILGVLACNMITPMTSETQTDPALTITALAMTIQAQNLELLSTAPPANTPLSTEIPALTLTPTLSLTPTVTFTPSVTLTFTPSVPMVTVSQDTNCRLGPAKFYDYVSALLIGDTAEVVGKNTEINYWIIKNPDGAGTCWLWGNYATVSGNVAALPEVAIPPTPTPASPAKPTNLTANQLCFLIPGPMYQLGGSVSWDDVENEDGYNLYVNPGVLINTVGANVTTAPLPQGNLPPGGIVLVSVEAFNAAGKSEKAQIQVTCP